MSGKEIIRGVRSKAEFSNVPFMMYDDYEDGWKSPQPWEAHNRYFVVLDQGKIVGARKFYELPWVKSHINKFLESQGIPPIQGRVFTDSYVGVDESYRGRGLGKLLYNAVEEHMKPGDVFVFGSHEPPGAILTSRWLRQKPAVNVIRAPHGHYVYYADYEPTKKNFVIQDANQHKVLEDFQRKLARFSHHRCLKLGAGFGPRTRGRPH